MSAAESRAAIDRLVTLHNESEGPEDFAAYALLALSILAHHSPEVVTFILDRADQTLEATS